MKTYPTLMVLLAVLTFLVCLPDQAIALQEQDQVSLQVLDSQQTPMPNVKVALIIYRFNARGTTAESIPSGNCTTDRNGRCQIPVGEDAPKDSSGFLRGALDLGERGKRSVLWPGGLFEVVIQLNSTGKLKIEGEAAPFDYDEVGGVQVTQPQPPIYLIGIPIAIFFIGLALYLYRRSKAQ